MSIDRRRLVETLNAMGAAAPPPPPDAAFVRALEERLIALQMRGPGVPVVRDRARRRAPLRTAVLAAGLVAASGAAALVAPPVVRHIRSALQRSVPTPPSSTRPPLLPPSIPSPTVPLIAEPVTDTTFMSATTPTMPDAPPDTQPGLQTAAIAATTTPPPPSFQSEPTLIIVPTTSTTTTTTSTTTTSTTTTTTTTTSTTTTTTSTTTTPPVTTTPEPTSTVTAGERRINVPILPLSCASLPSSGVRCLWSPLPAGATGRILRSIPGASVGRVFFPPADARSYLDTTAGAGIYGYRIQALGADGQIVAQSEPVAITVA